MENVNDNDKEVESTMQAEPAKPEAPKERAYSQSELTAILSRKENKWEKQYGELNSQLEKLRNELESKMGKELSAEEKIEKMQQQFKKEIEKERAEKERLMHEHTSAKIESELMKAASKTTRPELVARLLRDKVQYNNETKTVHGLGEFDSPVSLDEMVTSFMESYPEFKMAPPSGSGTKAINRSAAWETKPNQEYGRDLSDTLQAIKEQLRNRK